jgi:hypothetical protein
MALGTDDERSWRDRREVPLGSAQEDLAVRELFAGLTGTLLAALEVFADVASAYPRATATKAYVKPHDPRNRSKISGLN